MTSSDASLLLKLHVYICFNHVQYFPSAPVLRFSSFKVPSPNFCYHGKAQGWLLGRSLLRSQVLWVIVLKHRVKLTWRDFNYIVSLSNLKQFHLRHPEVLYSLSLKYHPSFSSFFQLKWWLIKFKLSFQLKWPWLLSAHQLFFSTSDYHNIHPVEQMFIKKLLCGSSHSGGRDTNSGQNTQVPGDS